MGEVLVTLWANSLWQGLLVTAIVAAGVGTCRGMNAATRERVWWCALMAVVVMPLLPLTQSHALASAIMSRTSTAGPPAGASLLTLTVTPFVCHALVVVWAAWSTVSLLRIGRAFVKLRRLKSRALAIPVEREARLINWEEHKTRGRTARLVVSDGIRSAAALGFRRPVIAVSPDTLARLTDTALDQIVIHEYAHIQRRDDFAVLGQRIVVALAGLNPVVWWLDRAITLEREVACDDCVVAHTGGAACYATSLVELAAFPVPREWSISPGAALSRSQLAIRVRRLLQPDRNANIATSRAALWLVRPIVILLGLSLAAAPLVNVTFGLSPVDALVSSAAAAAPDVVDAREIAEQADRPELPVPDRPIPAARASDIRVNADAAQPPADTPVPSVNEHARMAADAAGSHDDRPGIIDARPFGLSQVGVAPPPALPPATGTELAAAPATSTGFAWSRVADPGIAVGQGSRLAAVGTARFFARLGKSIAGSF